MVSSATPSQRSSGRDAWPSPGVVVSSTAQLAMVSPAPLPGSTVCQTGVGSTRGAQAHSSKTAAAASARRQGAMRFIKFPSFGVQA